MSLRIVTDSASDLSSEQAAELGITLLPLFIHIGEQSYRDNVDLGRSEFYRRLPEIHPAPLTAAPGVGVFRAMYERLAAEGAQEILSIHVASRLSSLIDTARSAAREARNVAVTVFDSGQLSLGMGFAVQAAARAALAKRPLAEVVHVIESCLARTHVFAVLDSFTYLRRSGRVNTVIATMGSLLQIKPIMKMHAGVPTAERVRTQVGAIRRLIELLKELVPLEQAALVHANAHERAEQLLQDVRHLLPGRTAPLVEISPVIGTHIGPGAVGFVCVRKERGSV